MKLYLDDVRNTPAGYDCRCYTAQQAIHELSKGHVDFISFDHDLGAPENGTGYDVAVWIENEVYKGNIKLPDYVVHSANPVGANNIKHAMQSAKRFLDKQ